jgi:hypothetical protein
VLGGRVGRRGGDDVGRTTGQSSVAVAMALTLTLTLACKPPAEAEVLLVAQFVAVTTVFTIERVLRPRVPATRVATAGAEANSRRVGNGAVAMVRPLLLVVATAGILDSIVSVRACVCVRAR